MIARLRDSKSANLVICAAMGLITVVVYLPVLHSNFLEYDDQQYVTDNARVQAGLTWESFKWAFGFHAGNWHPLAWLSHMLDCEIFGARAGGHHFTNVLLHVATTILLFSVLKQMTGSIWRSAAVAALFAWHPLHVESVAWISERKDVLCAFFWMLTLWFYVRFSERPSLSRYIIVFVALMFCLMAKPMAVTLPFVLLLLDFWPLNRFEALSKARPTRFAKKNWLGLILEKIPFLALVAVGCALTLHAQQIAIVSTAGLPISQRITHTLVAYNHYLWAMFMPLHLSVYYPYVIQLAPTTVAFSGGVILLTTALALIFFRSRPWLVVGWLWFLGTLVPVIGLVQVGDQAWADRYTYIPFVGLFVALVWVLDELIKNKTALYTIAMITAVTILALTSRQLRYWKNTWTLFDHANKVTQENYMAVTVLASQLAKQGKLDEAIALYHTALDYKPTFPEAHFFLGNAFDQLGKLDEAVVEYQKALWFKPTQEQTHIFLGIVLGKQKKYDQAITNYQAAIALNPDSAPAHNNLARIFHTQGKLDEAVEHYQAALKLNPKLALAHNNLGILLLQKNQITEGTTQLRDALRLNPTNSETQFNLALALNQQQQWGEAAELFAKAIGPNSKDPKAHYEFATALAHLKRTREAMSEYASALLLQPDFPDALDGLAWLLSTDANAEFRNGAEAAKMAERACVLTERKDSKKLKTLAAAYAEAGRFEDAVYSIKTAIESTTTTNRDSIEMQAMLEQFQHSRPWRDTR